MANDQAEPAPKGRSLSEIAGIAVVGVTISAAVLYSFGVAYQNGNLLEFGFDPRLFPVDFHAQVVLGGVVGYKPVYALFVGVFIGGLLLLLIPAVTWLYNKVIGRRLQMLVAWLRKKCGHEKPPKSEKAPTPASKFWPQPLLRWFGILICAWAMWIAVLWSSISSGRTAATNTLKEIEDAPCGRASATVNVGLALKREEDGEFIRLPGWRIICSERFCGLHDGRKAIVVSLEGVKRMQTELPEGCSAASPRSTEKSSPDS